MKRTQSTKRIAEAFGSRGRTSLYTWLWDHYDELPEYRRYRVDWAKFTAVLSDLGVKGRDEAKPLNADVVRKTFERVRQDKEASKPPAEPAETIQPPSQDAEPPSPQASPPGGPQANSLPVPPIGLPEPARSGSRPRYTFQTARFKQSPEGA